jgi:RNA polymerase subunit RPABC4/transcription elongation factor Spt4
VSGDDYFECKSCKRVAVLPKDNEDRTHCPLCGSEKGRVVPSAIAKRLFEIGAFTPVDPNGNPKKPKDTRRH